MNVINFRELMSSLNNGSIESHRKLELISESCITRIEKYTGVKLKLCIGYSGGFGSIVYDSFFNAVAVALHQEQEMIHYHRDSKVAKVWHKEQVDSVNRITQTQGGAHG